MVDFHRPEEWAPPSVALLDVLSLERLDRNLYRAAAVFDERFPLFGGQVAAQALLAAGRTVDADRLPHSLHGYFLRPGNSSRPVVLSVARDRDGGRYSARRVVALQDGEVILNLSASFQVDQAGADLAFDEMPKVPAPQELPLASAPPRLIDFEQRLPEQPGETFAFPTRAWMRCTAELPDERLLHSALLTYMSDLYTGLGGEPSAAEKNQTTLSHTMWFHRPARMDEPVLMDLRPQAASGGRAFYTGSLWRPDGVKAASLAQETLYVPRRTREGEHRPNAG